jgi:hypothetical protein
MAKLYVEQFFVELDQRWARCMSAGYIEPPTPMPES